MSAYRMKQRQWDCLINILVEPDATANIPKHVFVARAFSPVFNSTHAIVQVMNINPTAVTLYGRWN